MHWHSIYLARGELKWGVKKNLYRNNNTKGLIEKMGTSGTHTHTHTITGTNVRSENVPTQWWSQTWWRGLAKLDKCNHCDQSVCDTHWNMVWYYAFLPSFSFQFISSLSALCTAFLALPLLTLSSVSFVFGFSSIFVLSFVSLFGFSLVPV